MLVVEENIETISALLIVHWIPHAQNYTFCALCASKENAA